MLLDFLLIARLLVQNVGIIGVTVEVVQRVGGVPEHVHNVVLELSIREGARVRKYCVPGPEGEEEGQEWDEPEQEREEPGR